MSHPWTSWQPAPNHCSSSNSSRAVGVHDDEETLEPSLEDAVVTDTGEELKLELNLDCCTVSLVGDGIVADELRSVAQSLDGLSYDEWRAALGDRVLVDGQTA